MIAVNLCLDFFSQKYVWQNEICLGDTKMGIKRVVGSIKKQRGLMAFNVTQYIAQ